MTLADFLRPVGRLTAWIVPSIAVLAGPAAAQDSTYTVSESGDALLGFGIGRYDAVHIDLNGRWMAQVATDDTLATDIQADQAWIDSSGTFQAEGEAVSSPAGATLDGWGALPDTDDAGNLFQLLYLSGTSGGGDDLGLYRNGQRILGEGAGALAPGLTAGTTYDTFLNFKVNGAGTQILLVATVDDPAIPGNADMVLMRITINSGTGQILGQAVIAKEGDILPGQTQPVAGIGAGPHEIQINDAGDVMYFVDLAGDEALDGAIYLNSTVLAQEGSLSFDGVRNWGNLASHGMDLNDAGEYVFQATLDNTDPATDRVLALNGTIYKQEGSGLPGLPPFFTITNFGPTNGPVEIDDAGNVFWYVEYSSSFGTRMIWFNDTLKVQQQTTVVDGAPINVLGRGKGSFSATDAGQTLIFRGENADGTSRVMVLDTGPAAVPTDAPTVAPAASRPFLKAGPNPFAGDVEVRFAIARDSDVRLQAYDVTGRRVADLLDGNRLAGEHRVRWNGLDSDGHRVAPGVYFLRLRTADEDLRTRVVRIQ